MMSGHHGCHSNPNAFKQFIPSNLRFSFYLKVFNTKASIQHDDELELGEGDVVYVFEKCLDGWFIGAHGSTGAIGTFPGNYTIEV